jgi:hypothetical protein
VVVVYAAKVKPSRVKVGFAITHARLVNLIVKKAGGTPVKVKSKQVPRGRNVIRWNRKLHGSVAGPGRYVLRVKVATGTHRASDAIRVHLD